MSSKYKIFNTSEELALSFNKMIEFYDYNGTEGTHSFVFCGVDRKYFDLCKNESYSLQCEDFEGRLDFGFRIKKFHSYENNLFLNLNISSGMYEVGALSLLEFQSEDEKRIWLDMKGNLKRKYISASYIKNGFPREIKNEKIIIEGKCIQDYYSFYCELGYALFGNYGYIGNNLNAVCDLLNDLVGNNQNIIWNDSELSFKAIDNSLPEGYYQSSSEYILSLLEDYFNLELK
ncbi:barstar family protein [Xenorhabdus sp. DI]|uniref:hypothetical protein n=1 Tax=Xenorhabdus doucetiae TaxID=351671 RepID=UPI0019C7B51C|nr:MULTISPECIES: hypothetical protein [unclassified Xenorhabdus]MBD2785030.1 barstar family protein [Xenorhabdus sp. 3]MBD2787328.1 barstar family protein [Xenorhabdus sp. DI]